MVSCKSEVTIESWELSAITNSGTIDILFALVFGLSDGSVDIKLG
jgi:hypothetical protein